MKRKTFLSQTHLPLSSWKKQIFIDRLHSRFSGIKQLREYSEDESFGLTHIFIRVGLSIEGHLLAGIFTMGIANLAVETNAGRRQSIHKYFDTQTGEFLGHNRQDAAERLFQIGNCFCNESDYSKAREYFNSAYKNCDDEHRRQQFRERREQADKAMQEEQALRQRQDFENLCANKVKEQQVSGANTNPSRGDSNQECLQLLKLNIKQNNVDKSLSQQATEISPQITALKVGLKQSIIPTEEAEIVFEKNVNNFNHAKFSTVKTLSHPAKQKDSRDAQHVRQQSFLQMRNQTNKSFNKEAEQFYNDGMIYLRKKQYAPAKLCFCNALQKCPSDYKPSEKFQKMKISVETLIKQDEENKQQNESADVCYRLGMGHLWRNEFASAKTCFEDAYLKCTADYINRPLFTEKQLICELGIRKEEQEKWQNRAAEDLFSQGVSRLQGEDFAGASLCFSRAYHKCTQNYDRKQTFLIQSQEAEREVEKRSRNIKAVSWVSKR